MSPDAKASPAHGAQTALLAAALAVFVALLAVALFLQALCASGTASPTGPLAGDPLAQALGLPAVPVALGMLALAALVALVAVCPRRRDALAACGAAALTDAVALALAGQFGRGLLPRLSAGWERALAESFSAFSDYALLCAFVLVAAGAVCLSVHACLVRVERSRS